MSVCVREYNRPKMWILAPLVLAHCLHQRCRPPAPGRLRPVIAKEKGSGQEPSVQPTSRIPAAEGPGNLKVSSPSTKGKVNQVEAEQERGPCSSSLLSTFGPGPGMAAPPQSGRGPEAPGVPAAAGVAASGPGRTLVG